MPLLSHLPVINISIHAPRAGSDNILCIYDGADSDFNPRPPCGERRRKLGGSSQQIEFQSTPPVRGATDGVPNWLDCVAISIHAPRAGSDCPSISAEPSTATFQSTPPVRGATFLVRRCGRLHSISIHAPRAGSDLRRLTLIKAGASFQSTPPVRGATVHRVGQCRAQTISIHAPRAGSD